MIDLRNYATADLVEELERREKVLVVETFTGRSGGYVVRADSISCPKTISGPARILVVRGEQP